MFLTIRLQVRDFYQVMRAKPKSNITSYKSRARNTVEQYGTLGGVIGKYYIQGFR